MEATDDEISEIEAAANAQIRTMKKRRKNRVLVQRVLQTRSGPKMSSEQVNADTPLNTLATDTVVPLTLKRKRGRPPKDKNIVNDRDIQSREISPPRTSTSTRHKNAQS